MKVFTNIVVLVLLTASIFAYIGNSIPQISSAPTASIEIGESPEELVKAGKAVFERENSCLTCHSIGEDPKARCPNQEGVWIRAATRKPDMSAAQYLAESVYDPNAYIVEGYPKDQMKPINKPPLVLTDDEIKAALCYLVSLSTPVDNEIVKAIDEAQQPYKTGKVQVAEAEAGIKLPPGDPEEGNYTFEEMKCLQCHVVFGKGGEAEEGIGPELTNIGAIQTREYLAESIIDPNAVIVKGEGYTSVDGLSKMPEYHDTLTLRQLIDIVAYMETLKGK